MSNQVQEKYAVDQEAEESTVNTLSLNLIHFIVFKVRKLWGVTMNNWKDLIEKVAKKAADDGLLGDSEKLAKELLPSPKKASLETAEIKNIIKKAIVEIEKAPRPPQDENILSGAMLENPPEKPIISRAESITKAEIIIQEQLDYLESWTNQNIIEARKDWWRFWVFKIPAIICSVSITAFESFGYGNIVIVLGVISALCIGIDSTFPGGQLHNVHKRAANETRRLQHDVITKWRQVQFDESKSVNVAIKTILDEIQIERTRIDKYVTDAEASLGKSQTPDIQ
jgi:hypothetical protein